MSALSVLGGVKAKAKSHLFPIDKNFWYGIIVVSILGYLLGSGLLGVIYGTFYVGTSLNLHPFSIENWILGFGNLPPILQTTVIYVIGSATVGTAVAVLVSFTISRTDAPFGRLYYFVVFSIFFLPPVAWENSWILLFSPGGLYTQILGFNFNIHSLAGMIIVESVRTLPFSMILLVPVFAAMDKQLEDASRIAGGNLFETTYHITLKILLPGIATVFLIILIIALESFRIPILIGLPNKVLVLSSAIYSAIEVEPTNYGLGFVYSAILVGLALPLFFLYRRVLSQSEQFVTVSGRGYQGEPADVGSWKYVLSGLVGLFLLATVVMPVLMMFYVSLLPYFIPISSVSFSQFSLAAYAEVFSSSRLLQPLIRSIWVAFVTATILVLMGVIISWIIAKSDIDYKSQIDYLSFLPLAIPAVSLAVGLIIFYVLLFPIGIYGTFYILIIAFITRYIPGTVRIIYPAMVQIDNELFEMSRVSGASRIRMITGIVMPLVRDSIEAAWSLRYAIIFMEFPIVVMLSNSETRMIAAFLLEQSKLGNYNVIAALGVLAIILLGAIVVGAHSLRRVL